MLKNYASISALPNIFNDIEKTLATHGARKIIRDYDNQGRISAISFLVQTKMGPMAVRLPAKYDQVKRIFDEQGIRYKTEQPYRTAWATIRDWVSAQMALLDWEMVKIEEIFLPYALNEFGETYFDLFESGKLKPQLPSGT